MRLLARGLALLIMVLPGVTLSLGLGELEINTALNQPLIAQIKLHSVREDELEDMRVTVASETAFERAGIDRPLILNQLRFTPRTNSAGQSVIEVTTKVPVREPFLNFLLEVQWPKGRLLREYTVLLDPPVMFEQADVVGVQPPVSESYSSTTSTIVNQPSAATGNVSRAQPYSGGRNVQAKPIPSSKDGSRTYRTKSGDTLSEIATRLRPDESTSLPQMMIALMRANPESFIRGNINELMAGVIMRVPTQEEADSVERAWASAEVLRQNMLWREYRSKLTANVPTKPSEPLGGQLQSSTQDGRIKDSPRSQESAEKATDGKLEILAADKDAVSETSDPANNADIADLRKDAVLARELAESRSAENTLLKSKIQQLEDMLARQERLINLQSEELSTLQNRLLAVEESAASIVAEVTDESSVTELGLASEVVKAATDKEPGQAGTSSLTDQSIGTFEESVAAAGEPDAATASIGSSDQEASAAEKQEGAVEQSPAAVETKEADNASDNTVVSDTSSAPENQEQPTAAPVTEVTKTETPETLTFTGKAINFLTTNIMMLAAIAGAVLLLAVLSWQLVKRFLAAKKTDQNELPVEQTADSTAQTEASAAPEVDASDQGFAETLDSSSESAGDDADQDTPQSRPHELPVDSEKEKGSGPESKQGSENQDDTLTEADVYIAYNLHQQAEDLLKEAIAGDPERDDYRVKLLENYCAAGDRESFDVVAQELYSRLDGGGEQWERVLALAANIWPDHPMLTGSMSIPGTDSPPQASPQESGVESQPEDTLEAQIDLDGDMDSGYLSELASEQDQAVSDEVASSDEGAEGALEFDVSDLDLSFQENSLEPAPEGEVSVDELPDSNLLDFELSDLDLGTDGVDDAELLSGVSGDDQAQDGLGVDSNTMFESVESPDYSSEGQSELSPDAMQVDVPFPSEDSDMFSVDSDLQEPIDGTDIDSSDIEFEQSTSAIDLDEEISVDALSADSPVDDGSLMHMEEAETEVLQSLTDEPQVAGSFEEALDDGMLASPQASSEDSGLADFSALDMDADLGDLDQQGDALSLDDMASDWGADDQDSLQLAVDENAGDGQDAALDLGQETNVSESADKHADSAEDFSSESDPDLYDGLAQDPPGSIDEGETESLADLDAFLTDMPDGHSHSEQLSSSDLEGSEPVVATSEDAHKVVEQEGTLTGEEAGAFEEFDVLDEINTKLDLARAYIDMGDSEGARSALDEVLHQGSDEQRKEAEDLIKQIA